MKTTTSQGKKYLKGKGLLMPEGSISSESQAERTLYALSLTEQPREILLGVNDRVFMVVNKANNLHIDYPIVRENETYKIYEM